MTDIILSTQNGEPVASSRQIAENFGKEHKDVLRAIENIKADSGDIVIPVYLGGTILDEVIVSAQQRANLRSGGR